MFNSKRRTLWRPFTLTALIVVAAGLGIARVAVRLQTPEAEPLRPDVSFTSLDGSTRFNVPKPGDREYADYLEMLAHPRFRSALVNNPGYALPYDPEWRSVVRGRREVAPNDKQLAGGMASVQELAAAFTQALERGNERELFALRITREEFETILWPEFPQSRPYVKIPAEEAWMMQHMTSVTGIRRALQEHKGQDLELVDVQFEKADEFTNFSLLRNVVIRVRERSTSAEHEITTLPVIVNCRGRFKAYMYEDA